MLTRSSPLLMDDDPNRARVRIDARKWAASEARAEKYGDRVTQEISGGIAVTAVERRIVRPPAIDPDSWGFRALLRPSRYRARMAGAGL